MSKTLQHDGSGRGDGSDGFASVGSGPARGRAQAARRAPTMVDVARRAGVSTGTVSHALSGARQVAPATRRKVERAIRELDFRPNYVARSLMRGRTMTVGMVVPDIINPIFAQLLGGAEDALAHEGYAVLFGNSENEADKERRYLEAFQERQVDGIIVDVATGTDEAGLRDLRASLPVVLVDHLIPSWLGDYVQSEDEQGMALVVDHLVSLGHRRIALINGELIVSGAVRRLAGFEDRLAHHGLEPAWISSGTFTIPSGREQVRALLESNAEATAICAGNDVLAMGVLAALQEEGIAVPGTMSVTGYDDIEFAATVTPGLSTVTQPMHAMGAAAARLLLQRIRRPDEPAQRVVLRGQLMARGSTGPKQCAIT